MQVAKISVRLGSLLAGLAALWALFRRLKSQQPRSSQSTSTTGLAQAAEKQGAAAGKQDAAGKEGEAALQAGHEVKSEPEPAPEEEIKDIKPGVGAAEAAAARKAPRKPRPPPPEDAGKVARARARSETDELKVSRNPLVRDTVRAVIELHCRSREPVNAGYGVETSYVPTQSNKPNELALPKFRVLGFLVLVEVVGLICLVLTPKAGFMASVGILLMCLLIGYASFFFPSTARTRLTSSKTADALHALAEVRHAAIPELWKEVTAWAARTPAGYQRGLSWKNDVAFLVEVKSQREYQAFVVESAPLRVHHYITRPDATSASAAEAAWGLRAFLAGAEAGDGIIAEEVRPSGVRRESTTPVRKYTTVKMYLTEKDTPNRVTYTRTDELMEGVAGDAQEACIFISPKDRSSKPWIGFGGSFTESSARVFSQMSKEHQEEVLQAYFSPQRAGYTIGRVSMGSCDFGLGNWTCGDLKDGDEKLSNFSIDHYHKEILPLYHRAAQIVGAPLWILASPWSPPPWMKTKRQFNGDAHLRRESSKAWANHFVRFVKEMTQARMPIMAVSVQNEPEASQIWESCIYTAEEERDFVRDHLGPALEEAGLSAVKVLIWDHNRDGMFERAQIAYADPEAAKYIWGCAYHWYGDARFEVWPERSDVWFMDRHKGWTLFNELKARLGFENVRRVAELRPDKHILFTEGCQELSGVHLQHVQNEWMFGERYAMNILADINNGTEGWIDWNLFLNEDGGPNHVGNNCLAPIIYDTKNQQVHYTPAFHFMCHFSRFIRPGARRVLCSSSRDGLEVVSFINPDDTLILVVLNKTSSWIAWKLKVAGEGPEPLRAVSLASPPSSIETFVIE